MKHIHMTPRKTVGVLLLVVSLAGIGVGAAALVGKPITLKGTFPEGGLGPLNEPNNQLSTSFGDIGRAKLLATLGDPKTSGLEDWPGVFDVVATTADLNGDGQDEIIAHSNDTMVYVFAQNGKVLARLETGYPPDWYRERVLNSVSVGVMRPGEAPSVIVANGAAFIQSWRYDAAQSTTDTFAFQKMWEVRADTCFGNPGMDANPVLADVDGDQTLEVLVNTEETGLFAYNADGKKRWHKCWAGGNAEPVVADLEGDGRMDAIFASDSGVIAVVDASTGATKWTFGAADPAHGIKPGSISVAPVVAQLDGVKQKEIIFTARYAPSADPELFDEFHMAIFAIHFDSAVNKPAVLWKRQPDWAHPLSYTHLLVEDVDKDGKMDIFGMDWNTIGHKPGNWQNLGPAHVFRLDAQGQDVWVAELDVWWSNKDIFLFDSDEDGTLELYANGAYMGNDGIWRLDVLDGERDGFLSAAPWKLMRGPVVANLRHDDATQLVIPVAPNEPVESRGAILVFELDRGG